MARHMEPWVASVGTTIQIPLIKKVDMRETTRMDDIAYWEAFFITQRDQAKKVDEKRQLDRCRATLKYAQSCNAYLKKIFQSVDVNEKSFVEFTFIFNFKEECDEFLNNLVETVENAIV